MRTLLRRASFVRSGVVITLATFLADCASRGGRSSPVVQDPSAGVERLTRIEGPGAATEFHNAREPGFGVQLPLRAPAERAFDALQPVYEALGFRFNTLVTETRIGGTQSTPAPERIGKLPLSRFLQCGVEGIGSPNADTHAVTITAVSRIDVVGPATSVVQTQILATATGRSTSGNMLRCRSNGRLEKMINEALAARVES